MARYPSSTWKPISGTGRTRLTKDLLCLHTAVGYATSTWNYFNRADVGVYSHFVIGGPWGSDGPAGLDGVAWQMADTDYRAAANLDGNWRIISVETADNAARPIAMWTPKQCDKIVDIMVDAHRLDGIPLELVPDSKPGRRGVAYHRLGCDPYRVAGGEKWSSSYGKDCPTDVRIHQIPALIARATAIVNPTTPNAGDDMQPTDLNDAATGGHLDPFFTRMAAMLGAQGIARGVDVRTSAAGIAAAVAAVRADVAVQGDDETRILTKLAEIEAMLPASTPGA